jgi:TusA-related sulfurtransferase
MRHIGEQGGKTMKVNIDHFLDITSEVCPMTFVRTRLLIEKMAAGETAEIRLKGQEPLENVPDSVAELGHDVLNIRPDADDTAGNVHCILIRKN